MRILFMGTPDIAAESLAALLDAGHEVCGVFTRRDKPVGRKQILTAPPVKQLAVEHGLSVYQPRTLRDGSSDELIKELAPDIIVVVAYGCIIPPQLLHAAKYGCINLHVSLLPKYRGSAPIQWAVLNGDEGTGVTIMQLDEGLDTGDILMVEPVTIDPEETSGDQRSGTHGADEGHGTVRLYAGCRPHPQLGARHEPVARGVVHAGRQAHQGVGKPPGRKPAARSPRHRAGPEAADDCR